MRRQARLFALAEYLRGRRTGVTAETLAERFGVTVRTIYRDLDALRDAALPVQADRGRGGGYALDRSYTLPPVNFTAREAALLVAIGQWATEMRLLPFADTLACGLDKVRGALTASAQRELGEQIKKLRFVGVPSAAVRPEIRRTVEQAWFEQQPLRIDYRHANFERSSHSVLIRGVLIERTMTVLECDDLEGKETRGFRLDRVERAMVLASPAPVQAKES
jgi:predicted DNA-binding transcriptional regulator YafY